MPQAGHQYYEEAGTGLPLVLVHGHTLDGRMWEPVLPYLVPHCRVIMPDMAGHGRSGLSPEGDALADDLAALLRHLGIRQAALCGLSMGGAAAVSFALHHREMCAALIPVDAALFGYRFTQWPGTRPYVLKARAEGLEPALEAWLGDPLFAPAMQSSAAPLIRRIVTSFPGRPWLEPSGPLHPAGKPEAERLGEIMAPTLVLVGEQDLADFQQIAGLLATAIPNARKAVIPGAGHLVPLEQPQLFAQAVLDFLGVQPGA